jgi:hypothetical protein
MEETCKIGQRPPRGVRTDTASLATHSWPDEAMAWLRDTREVLRGRMRLVADYGDY